MNQIFSILLDVILFLVILIVYFFALKAIFSIPSAIAGIVIGRSKKNRSKGIMPQVWQTLSQVEGITTSVLSIIFLSFAFLWNIWSSTWFHLWQSPLFIGLIFLIFITQAQGYHSDNPVIRNQGRAIMISVIPSVLLIAIGVFSPATIKVGIFKWAVTLSATILAFVGFIGGRVTSRNIKKVEEFKQRHQALQEPLTRLQKITNVLGDTDNRETIEKANTDVNIWALASIMALQQGQYQEADTLIIQAEKETDRVNRIFQDRLRLSLRDELQTRLHQSSVDITKLKQEFVATGLNPADLSQLSNRVTELEEALGDLDITDVSIGQIEPFDELSREIVETRVALRFRRNLGSEVNSITQEVDKSSETIKLAQNLGISVSDAEERKKAVSYLLTKFQSPEISKPKELMNTYHELQKELSAFQVSMGVLESSIERNWSVTLAGNNQINLYIPKSITTADASRGAVLIKHDEKPQKTIKIHLDGTLIELQSETVVEILPSTDSYSIKHFSFAGKRGGTAALTLTITDSAEVNYQISSDIRVKSSIAETARDALLFGTPIGGIAILVMWGFGLNLKDLAVPLGGAIGGTTGLLIFIINYVRNRR